jgi:hypothetical protein
VAENSLVIADAKGRMTLFTNVNDAENMRMHIVMTEQTRIKSIRTASDCSFFVSMTASGVQVWNTAEFIKTASETKDDHMIKLSP